MKETMKELDIGQIADRMDITDLMNGWMHRDLEQWDALRELFHPDGEIEVTWFEGKFSDFVNASMQMGKSSARSSHLVGSPIITLNGDKAIAETNMHIFAEDVMLGIGALQHSRAYDLVEKHNGVWKIIKRQCIYDMGTFTFPRGFADIDTTVLDKYPREYAPLAYVLGKSGFPVNRVFATKESELESKIKEEGKCWLKK